MASERTLVSQSSQKLLLQLQAQRKISCDDGASPQRWKTSDHKALKDGTRRGVFWPKEEVHSFDAKHFKVSTQMSKIAPNRDERLWRTGASYTGDWKNNLKHGFGVQIWSDGSKYEGQWAEGMRSGHGVLWLHKRRHAKKMAQAKASKPGSHHTASATSLSSIGGAASESGFALTDMLASSYETGGSSNAVTSNTGPPAARKGGRKSKDVLVKVFDGEWLHDLKHGIGTYFYAPNERYEGEWVCGMRSGQGKMVYASGEVYSGEWSNDQRSGYGLATYPNGNSYEGEWAEDKKEGPGEFFYKSQNKVYVGEWANDVAQCGVFRDAEQQSTGNEEEDSDDDEENSGDRSPEDKPKLPLPQLRLKDPEKVLLDEISRIRAERDAARCPEESVLGGELSRDTSGVLEPSQQSALRATFDNLADATGYISAVDILRFPEAAEHSETEILDVLDMLAKRADDNLNFYDVTRVLHYLSGDESHVTYPGEQVTPEQISALEA